jgi:hypothetical protein
MASCNAPHLLLAECCGIKFDLNRRLSGNRMNANDTLMIRDGSGGFLEGLFRVAL